jgi:hypothetical protein
MADPAIIGSGGGASAAQVIQGRGEEDGAQQLKPGEPGNFMSRDQIQQLRKMIDPHADAKDNLGCYIARKDIAQGLASSDETTRQATIRDIQREGKRNGLDTGEVDEAIRGYYDRTHKSPEQNLNNDLYCAAHPQENSLEKLFKGFGASGSNQRNGLDGAFGGVNGIGRHGTGMRWKNNKE